jgi:hypothetical protein
MLRLSDPWLNENWFYREAFPLAFLRRVAIRLGASCDVRASILDDPLQVGCLEELLYLLLVSLALYVVLPLLDAGLEDIDELLNEELFLVTQEIESILALLRLLSILLAELGVARLLHVLHHLLNILIDECHLLVAFAAFLESLDMLVDMEEKFEVLLEHL